MMMMIKRVIDKKVFRIVRKVKRLLDMVVEVLGGNLWRSGKRECWIIGVLC